METSNSAHSGIHYFFQGWKLIFTPGIKRFVLLPILINIVLMTGAFILLVKYLDRGIGWLLSFVPDWLQWLSYLMWPLAIITVLLVFGYFFNMLANLIASPFNGLLSEKLEVHLTGLDAPDEGFSAVVKDVPRVVGRELQKLKYYLPRALGLFILSFIPVIGQLLIPVVWFGFNAWMQSIQYNDFPFDNHRVNFKTMRETLRKNRLDSLQFGALVMVFTLIPFLNLFIMPVAICGATAMWVDRYKNEMGRY